MYSQLLLQGRALKDELIVDFKGSFCKTCGAYDYLEDFIHELERFIDVGMRIPRFENYGPEKIRFKYAVNFDLG